jgi:hypothetical protein
MSISSRLDKFVGYLNNAVQTEAVVINMYVQLKRVQTEESGPLPGIIDVN